MSERKRFLGWENPGKALITGASAGIGLSFAQQLAQRGFDLILLARRRERLETAARKLESDCATRCEIVTADLSDMDQIKQTADLLQTIDGLDVLINNAGFATIGPFAGVPLEKSMRMFHLHATACVMLKIFIPGWKNRFYVWILQHSAAARRIVQNSVKKRSQKKR